MPMLNLAQNLTIRLGLSLPEKKVHYTLIDIERSGLSFPFFSRLDERLYSIVDENKQVEALFEKWKKEATSFIFKEISNKYSDFYDYSKKNKKIAKPYKIILFSGFSGKIAEEFVSHFNKLVNLANKAGVFFIIVANKRELEQHKQIASAIKNSMFIYDYTENTCYSANSDVEKWYNHIYKIEPATEISFSEETIFQINRDFDPIKYKAKPLDKKGINWIEETKDKVILSFKEAENDNLFNIALSDDNEDIWIFSNSEPERDKLFLQLINSLSIKYSPTELQLIGFGMNKEMYQIANNLPHWNILVSGNEPIYLYGLIEELENEINQRFQQFEQAPLKVNSYSEYRKISKQTMPRKVVLINDISKSLKGISGDFFTQLVEKFNQLILQCNQCGIHIIAFSEPDDSVLNFDLNYFTYRLFVNSDFELSKLFADISENHKDILSGTDKALIYNYSNKKIDLFELDTNTIKTITDNISVMKSQLSDDETIEKLLLDTYENLTHNSLPRGIIEQSADTISFYIGKPSWFTTAKDYKLTLQNEINSNVLITGKDENALQSVITSITKQCNNEFDIVVFDTDNIIKNPEAKVLKTVDEIVDFIDNKVNKKEAPQQNLFGLTEPEKQTLCFVINIETNIKNKECEAYFKKVSTLIENSHELDTLVFLNTSTDKIFEDDYLSISSKYRFGTKIICKETDENMLNILSPIIAMDEKLVLPKTEYSVLIETNQLQSNLSADPVKLYVNAE